MSLRRLYTKLTFTVLSICVLLAGFPPQALGQLLPMGLPEISNYLPKDYHAHPNNFGAIQDKEGILYFANLAGVLEFDGVRWRTILLPNSSSCTSLAIDSQGTIYVGGRSEFGYLRTDSLGRKTYVSLLHLLPKNKRTFNEVWNIYATKRGMVFTSFEQFIVVNGQKADAYYPKEKFGNAFLVAGDVWVADQGKLLVFSAGKFTPVAWGDYFRELFISTITPLGANQFLVGTNREGLFLVDNGTVSPWQAPINLRFKSSRIDKVIVTPNHYLVCSTLLSGIFITTLKGEIVYHLSKENGLSGNNVTHMYLDTNQNLWLSLINGIVHIPLFKPFSYLSEESGITGIAYASILNDRQLYLATSEGIYQKDVTQPTITPFQKANLQGLVWNLSKINNELFCGHVSSGYVYTHNGFEKITESGTWVFIPVQDKTRVLGGTYNGLELFERINNRWVLKGKVKGFQESSRFVVEDALGDIWVSHGNKGVYKLRLNKSLDSATYIKFYNSGNGLPYDFNNTVCKVNNHVLLATQKGIYWYNIQTEKLEPYLPLTRLIGSAAHVEKIIQTDPQFCWVIYDGGTIAKLKITSPHVYELVWVTEKFKGKLVNSFESITRISSEYVLISTQEGFVFFHEKSGLPPKKSDFTYKAFISQVSLAIPPYATILAGYSPSRDHTLSSHQNHLRFSFASNFYEDSPNTSYQFLLTGPDQKEVWSKWSIENYKEFTNLSPGKYVIRVRAKNTYGQLSAVGVSAFQILPPWYLTFQAYILYALLGGVVFFFITQTIRARFAREKKKQELQQQQLLWQKHKEMEETTLKAEKEIMELHQSRLQMEEAALQQRELLLQQERKLREDYLETEKKVLMLEKEKFESELGHKDTELTSLTLHITQKNEMLAKIKQQVNKAYRETKETQTKENLKQLEMQILKGMNSSREWEQFKNHFDIVHNDILKRLQEKYPELTTSSLKLCAYLKMRLSIKQIAILTNTSPESIAKASYRLRFKLNLEKGTRLRDFLNSF